jgi:hypothetical protein
MMSPTRHGGSLMYVFGLQRMLVFSAVLVTLTCVRARADEAPAPLRTEIIALTQQLMDAVGEGKADVWQRVLVDDALITDEYGRIQNKAEAVESIHPFPEGLSGSIEIRDPKVRVYGDTAVIDFEDYERETVFGQKLVVRYISSATYVRREGAWKLAGMLDVTLPTQPPMLSVCDVPLADYPGTYRYGPDRAFIVERVGDKVVFRTRAGRPTIALDPIARDVFMGGDDEKNLLIFRRDDAGHVTELIERRKFNDLHLKRDPGN